MTIQEATLRLLYLALAQFTYRCLPIALFSAFQANALRRERWSLACVSGLFVIACESADVPALNALARGAAYLAYFSAASVVLYSLPNRRVLHALGCVLLFLVVPGLVGFRIGPFWAQESIVLGWEAMFAAYSALVTKPRIALTKYLMFVLVDPTYVYAERSARRPTMPLVALTRASLGILIVAAQFALMSFVNGPRMPSLGSGQAARVVQLDVYALAIGLSHIGLSWMQIGSMAAAGYVTPPRFRNPLWSSSFHNFWQRWNVWLGRWGQMYVFVPLALGLKRHARVGRTLAAPIAALGTFALIGILHDVAGWCGRGLMDFRLGFSLLFALFGIVLCVERVLVAWLPKRAAFRYGGRAAFLLAGMPCLIWLSLPALQGNYVHPIFRSILGVR